jgi:hypothetical protein
LPRDLARYGQQDTRNSVLTLAEGKNKAAEGQMLSVAEMADLTLLFEQAAPESLALIAAAKTPVQAIDLVSSRFAEARDAFDKALMRDLPLLLQRLVAITAKEEQEILPFFDSLLQGVWAAFSDDFRGHLYAARTLDQLEDFYVIDLSNRLEETTTLFELYKVQTPVFGTLMPVAGAPTSRDMATLMTLPVVRRIVEIYNMSQQVLLRNKNRGQGVSKFKSELPLNTPLTPLPLDRYASASRLSSRTPVYFRSRIHNYVLPPRLDQIVHDPHPMDAVVAYFLKTPYTDDESGTTIAIVEDTEPYEIYSALYTQKKLDEIEREQQQAERREEAEQRRLDSETKAELRRAQIEELRVERAARRSS